MKYLGASLGNCVHVAGIINFFRIAEGEGHETRFLGAAVPVSKIFGEALKYKPDAICISYRLTAENVVALLEEISAGLDEYKMRGVKWIFGGTKPVVKAAKRFRFIDFFFYGGESADYSIAFLRGQFDLKLKRQYAQDIIGRISEKKPYPVLRHHFGLPSLDDTIRGIKTISKSQTLDVISLGPDQNAQEFFFHPEKMNKLLDGAGGVPIRSPDDFLRLYESTRTGNYPIMRCYSGTSDVFKMADVLLDTIHNAWAAIPLCWYNVLDGRGSRALEESIAQSQKLMRYHAQRNVPVEVNEAHHWSLRDAHDTIAVVMAYIAAYNAKKMGVHHYISQYMFNTPCLMTPSMDIAKMMAKCELIEGLHDDEFTSYRQVRTGLTSLSGNMSVAKGQLASSVYTSMALKPDIIHVVSFSEADHAATARNVIESCDIVHGVIRSSLGMTDMCQDSTVLRRRDELLEEAFVLLDFIRLRYADYEDPFSNPTVLADMIKTGIVDAPHLRGNPAACGKIETRMLEGKCVAYLPEKGMQVGEAERLEELICIVKKLSL